MPKEFFFFDTSYSAISLNNCPSELEPFHVHVYRSGETHTNHRTEAIVVVAVAIIVVEIEHASIGRIVVVAPAFEERIVALREGRVITEKSLIFKSAPRSFAYASERGILFLLFPLYRYFTYFFDAY